MGVSNNTWRNAVLGALGVSVIWPVVALAEVTASRAPNVVLLLADDLGFGDVSMHGAVLWIVNDF